MPRQVLELSFEILWQKEVTHQYSSLKGKLSQEKESKSNHGAVHRIMIGDRVGLRQVAASYSKGTTN